MGDDNGAGIILFFGLIAVIIAAGIGAAVGRQSGYVAVHDRCVVKYSDMPYNKVDQYCTTLLEFK